MLLKSIKNKLLKTIIDENKNKNLNFILILLFPPISNKNKMIDKQSVNILSLYKIKVQIATKPYLL